MVDLKPVTQSLRRSFPPRRFIGAAVAVCLIISAGCRGAGADANASADSASAIATSGSISFDIDTTELPLNHRGPLTTIGGHMEFAGGRGRLDITTVRNSPALSANLVTIAPPLARVGDYYLFDSTAFTLVRPASRTYSTFKLTRFTIRHLPGVIPDEQMLRPTVLRIDTLRTASKQKLQQHGSYTLRTHTDGWHTTRNHAGLGRVWIDVEDAPPGEAAVVRFFAAAFALATTPKTFTGLLPDSLSVTSILIVGQMTNGYVGLAITSRHNFSNLQVAAIDTTRLQVPAGFAAVPMHYTAKNN